MPLLPLRRLTEAADRVGRGEMLAGGTVPIFYDPEDPAQAVLEPGSEGYAALLTAFGVLLIGGAGWILLRRR